ncbi:IS110 family transposase [Streptomyces sp. RB6PN25]|uniref:IS110 family transposase n=1 Tax=Streptomyces humicola TaxID=2953240 RepID=A0ABT1PTC4_9ACTN|nr:IS110 family transposase [Streptomyces humicola]MCQ4080928.1 IS110 family transposase [Streptomyces humicola]
MDVLHERCAGLDISKKDAKACVRTPSTKRRGSFTNETTTWGSTTNAVLALREHLLAANVTLVVIEATSNYWKPYYYVLAEDLNNEGTRVTSRQWCGVVAVVGKPGPGPPVLPFRREQPVLLQLGW